MEFILAKTAGFCWGVRRALNKTLEVEVPNGMKVSSLGPLVHNPQVIDLLRYRDVQTVDSVEEINGGLAIIRTHGVPPKVQAELEKRAERVLDNTCPVVRVVQKLVRNYCAKGYYAVVFGEPKHPEIIGILGYADDHEVRIIQSAAEIEDIEPREKMMLVSQTTTNVQEWNRTMEAARKRFPGILVKDTMCFATRERQSDILDLCGQVDAMIVIGGKNSGNTTRLAGIARDEYKLPTWHIEAEEELYGVDFTPYARIGVTAGASTPSWSIDRIMAYLKTLEDESRSPVWSRIKQFLSTLVVMNVYSSLAAGALSYLGAALMGVPFPASIFALVFSYVLAMHVLNRYTEKGQDRFRDDPARVRFYERHNNLMRTFGVAAAAAAVVLSFLLGPLPFLVILFASIIGVTYSVKIIPMRLRGVFGFGRLKDIAASKNLFVAGAWSVVSVFPLFFITPQADLTHAFFAFLLLFLLTGIRSVVMDLTDMTADRLVGRETLPIVLGEKRTQQYVSWSGALLSALLFLLAGMGVIPLLGWPLAFWALVETLWFRRKGLPTGRLSVVRRDLLVDAHFIALGLFALGWSHFMK